MRSYRPVGFLHGGHSASNAPPVYSSRTRQALLRTPVLAALAVACSSNARPMPSAQGTAGAPASAGTAGEVVMPAAGAGAGANAGSAGARGPHAGTAAGAGGNTVAGAA